jgi:hypothetical protein
MIRSRAQEVEAKRQRVRQAYEQYGLGPEYEKEFEELHSLNMAFMAAHYRRVHDLLPWAHNPYKEEIS